MTSKTQTTKAKIKHESIYITKETTNKMKRQSFKELEKNFVNHILDKRLISKNIKNSVNFTTKSQTNLVKNVSNLSARYNSLTTQKQSIWHWAEPSFSHVPFNSVMGCHREWKLRILNGGGLRSGRGVGCGDHFLPHNFIKRSFEYWATSTEQLLNTS